MNNEKISAVFDILFFILFLVIFLLAFYNLMKGLAIKSVIANEINKKGIDKRTSVHFSYFESEVVRVLGDKKEVRNLYIISRKYVLRGVFFMFVGGLMITFGS